MIRRRPRLAALAFAAAAAWSAQAACAPAPVAPAATAFRLGALQLYALRDADNLVPNDGKTFGVGVPTAEVGAVLTAAGAPAGTIALSVDALLVKAPGRVMLFDAGLGPPAHGVLMDSLRQAGVTPQQVTDVFITHSHGDHVGGLLTPDGRPAFPRAAVRMSAREWAYLQSRPQNARLAQAIAPQVRTFEPGDTPVPGVTTAGLYGHTPGHTGYTISSQGSSLFDMGDSAHSSIISLARPEWTIEYDADADAGRATRRATLQALADKGVLVFAPHFPFPGVGHVVRAGGAFAWRPGLP